MANLRRGFRKEAEEYATEYREELGIESHQPLSPYLLADHLGIPVHRLSTFQGIPDELKLRYATHGKDEFSAIVLRRETACHVLHNDYQPQNRQASNIMHELSHVILGHEHTPPLTGDGERKFDGGIEKEANELGFTLLVPKRAALFAIEAFPTIPIAAKYFGVSESLLIYRIRITNASGWAKNRAQKYTAS